MENWGQSEKNTVIAIISRHAACLLHCRCELCVLWQGQYHKVISPLLMADVAYDAHNSLHYSIPHVLKIISYLILL